MTRDRPEISGNDIADEIEAERITVEWLHSVRPDGWQTAKRGIYCANSSSCSIHSVLNRPMNVPPDDPDWNYDAGPFVWSFTPSHNQNLRLLADPNPPSYTILVLENRGDVLRLFDLLRR